MNRDEAPSVEEGRVDPRSSGSEGHTLLTDCLRFYPSGHVPGVASIVSMNELLCHDLEASDINFDDFIDFEGSPDVELEDEFPRADPLQPEQGASLIPLFGQSDDEMVLPQFLQPVMAKAHSSSFIYDALDSRCAPFQAHSCRPPQGCLHDALHGTRFIDMSPDLNDPLTRTIYDQLLLFSHRLTPQHSLIFDECGHGKETLLRKLALDMFKLVYAFDPIANRVTISRPSAGGLPASLDQKQTSQLDKEVAASESSRASRSMCQPHHGVANDEHTSRAESHRSNDSFSPLRLSSEAMCVPSVSFSAEMPTAAMDWTTDLDTNLLSTKARGGPSLGSSPLGDDDYALLTLSHGNHATFRGTLTRNPRLAPENRLHRHPYQSSGGRPSVRERISTWTTKTLGKYGGRLGVLHEEDRHVTRRPLLDTCWRCKILKLKCDTGDSCKGCPAPSLDANASLWPLLGCRRGPLRDAMPPLALCPNAPRRHSQLSLTCFISGDSHVMDTDIKVTQNETLAECLRRAEQQRLQDIKATLGDAALDSQSGLIAGAASVFADIVKNRHYQETAALNKSYGLSDDAPTYADLITSISWELMNNPQAVVDLDIEVVENFVKLLEVAARYEGDVGSTILITLSLICLRDCLSVLRLLASGLLTPELHRSCSNSGCDAQSVQDLCSHVEQYVDELSRVMFTAENRDRKCWLSIFFSLYIQSSVRHGLLTIEKHLNFPGLSDPPFDALTSATYMHVGAILFIAASAHYDPLFDGQLESVGDNWVMAMETGCLESYLHSAQAICLAEPWPSDGVRTTFEFLRRRLQIGSLDFDNDEDDLSCTETAMRPAQDLGVAGSQANAIEPSGANNKPGCLSPSSVSASSVFDDMDTPDRHRQSLLSSIGSFSNTSYDSLPTNTSRTSFASSHIQTPLTTTFSDYAGSIRSGHNLWSPVSQTFPSNDKALPPDPSTRPLPEPPTEEERAVSIHEENTLPFICDCCPKRPIVFATSAELKAHTQKKPHICAICGSRSKNMNEAERHYNAVHLRPFSWSCTKLETPLSAFHCRTSNSLVSYVCGFCGRTFHREPSAAVTIGQELDELVDHVKADHNFGSCVSGKRFFRQDHFAAHLKASHRAERGAWLKVLVEFCKSDNVDGGKSGE